MFAGLVMVSLWLVLFNIVWRCLVVVGVLFGVVWCCLVVGVWCCVVLFGVGGVVGVGVVGVGTGIGIIVPEIGVKLSAVMVLLSTPIRTAI